MTYTITKEFAFSASHQLAGLPDDHQCSRLHGHNYVIAVELSSDWLNEVGFVIDYGELSFVKTIIDTQFDHRHLNDVLNGQPSAENMARLFHHIVHSELVARYAADMTGTNTIIRGTPQVAIGVSETPKTWAWYRP